MQFVKKDKDESAKHGVKRNIRNNISSMKIGFLKFFIFISLNIIFLLTACSINKTEKQSEKPKELKPILEQDLPKVDLNKVALGKILFFDPMLSRDRTVSCASCHRPDHAFSDDKPVSIGIKGQLGVRNTPTVFNTFRLKHLFWDGRAKSLEEQALGPIQNPKEMGENLENVLNKLNNLPYYRLLFEKTFGKGDITKEKLASAIAEFERTLISRDSDFDRFILGNNNDLSDSAQRGLNLFKGKAMCIACHNGPDFTDGEFHNIGLPPTEDIGRAKITGKSEDTRKFKTPTLREVANTAPYFHTGQFQTSEQVIAYYNAGGGSDPLKDPEKTPLELTPQEQKDLVDFLKSLSGRI